MVHVRFGSIANVLLEVQVTMNEAAPFKGELANGWIAHYAISIGYRLLLRNKPRGASADGARR